MLTSPEPFRPKLALGIQFVEDVFVRVQTAIRPTPVSVTQMVSPSAETATPFGLLRFEAQEQVTPNLALKLQVVESLSVRVQTVIRLLPESATQRVSRSGERTTPDGSVKLLSPEPLVPKVVWLSQVPALQVPAVQYRAELLQVTQAAPPVPQALTLVAVTQVEPSQHPFAQVAAVHVGPTGPGVEQMPFVQVIERQQFRFWRHAPPIWTHRQRCFSLSQTPVQHCLFLVHALGFAEPSPQGPSARGRPSPRAAPRLPAALAVAAPPSSAASTEVNPARREVAAPNIDESRSNRRSSMPEPPVGAPMNH
jgi:hypothetical protein